MQKKKLLNQEVKQLLLVLLVEPIILELKKKISQVQECMMLNQQSIVKDLLSVNSNNQESIA